MRLFLGEADVQASRKCPQTGTELPSPPRVSIGMPVFNGMRYIKRAVNALLAQSFTHFELIILDNSSTDGTYEFALTLTKDPRVRVERNDRNIGAIGNFIKVVGLARGEYFMWAAVDDLWKPEFVARLVAELDQHPAGLAMSTTCCFRQAGKDEEIVRFVELENPALMSPVRLALELGSPRKWGYFIYGLFRRALLQQAVRHFPEGGAPDRILMTQVALHSGFRYVDEVLYYRQLHEAMHEERYPNEAYSRVVAMGFWGDLHFLWSLCVALLASPVVPLRRKPYIPLIVGRFAATRVQGRFFPESTSAARLKTLGRTLKATQRSLKTTKRSLKATKRSLDKATRRLEEQQKIIEGFEKTYQLNFELVEKKHQLEVEQLEKRHQKTIKDLEARSQSPERPNSRGLCSSRGPG